MIGISCGLSTTDAWGRQRATLPLRDMNTAGLGLPGAECQSVSRSAFSGGVTEAEQSC